MTTDEDPIVVEQTFAASAETAWKAITRVDLMTQWFFDNIPAFEPRVGFETGFDVTCEDRLFPHRWKIIKVEDGARIVYQWRYDGWPGDATVAFELSGNGNSSTLRLTHTMIEDSPNDVPEFTREAGAAGWTYFIKENLKAFLERGD